MKEKVILQKVIMIYIGLIIMIIIVIILLKIKFNIIIEYITCNNKFKKELLFGKLFLVRIKFNFI